VFVNHLSNGSHSHVLSHQDNHGIHEQRESATFSSPGNLDLFHSAIFAFGTRNTTMDIGFKLKEIQVTPGSFIVSCTLQLGFRISRKEIYCLI
jgi:hypothetical protein